MEKTMMASAARVKNYNPPVFLSKILADEEVKMESKVLRRRPQLIDA